MANTTEQELFWKGEFGNHYVSRNRGQAWVSSNLAFFSRALARAQQVNSVLELGANIGLNLMALRQLLPGVEASAVEINEQAASELQANLPEVDVHLSSILDFEPTSTWDLVFTKGVLIHMNPDCLPTVYGLMYKSSARYILISEYYNPTPTQTVYRGHADRLFKRDFAGDLLDMYPDLSLIDYGFVYHRDPHFPQDDMTWFLVEKR